MSQYVEGPRKTFIAASAGAANLRWKISDATTSPPTIALAGVSDPCIGVNEAPVLATGDWVSLYLANAQGTRKMKATAAAITGGNAVYAAANGYVAATGTVVEGKSLESTAGAAGDILEVLPIMTVDLVATGGITLPTVTFNGLTGANEIVVPTNLADGLSIKDSAGDIVVITTSTGSQLITWTTANRFNGGVTIGTADAVVLDDIDIAFGTSSDTLLRFSTADASNHATVIAIDDTSQQIHVTDKAAVATDWNRTAGTHPELSIHSNTTPATDYLAIGNHDGTTAYIDVVGGTTLVMNASGSPAVTATVALTTVAGRLLVSGDVANTAGVGITGTASYYKTSVEKHGTLIKTTILIDLTNLNGGGTADDIIGANGAGAAHLGQHTVAVNGTNIAGKITCLEAPAGSNIDVDLWYADVATGVEDSAMSALAGNTKVCNAGNWTVGLQKATDVIVAADKYLYLASGSATDAAFTAGILLIELYGTA